MQRLLLVFKQFTVSPSQLSLVCTFVAIISMNLHERSKEQLQDRGVTPKLISSTATIRYKSMKLSDAIICDVLELKDWCEVESIVNHLTKLKFNGIHVDLEVKYSSKRNVNDAADVEQLDNSLSHTDDDISVIKYG